MRPALCFALLFIMSFCSLTSCSSIYYSTLERVGIAKRDLMAKRIRAAQESQVDAKNQFRSALEQFDTVLHKSSKTPLKEKYDALQASLEKSEAKAKDVHNRIAAVESVSDALFSEWKSELRQYSNASLREASARKLESTQTKYHQMLSAMKTAEGKIDPVLKPLQDDVLFLKHNLNAEAIDSLATDLHEVRANVDELIRDLERSIAEADSFVRHVDGEGAGA